MNNTEQTIRILQGADFDSEPETKDRRWILYPLAFAVFAIGAAWLWWGA